MLSNSFAGSEARRCQVGMIDAEKFGYVLQIPFFGVLLSNG